MEIKEILKQIDRAISKWQEAMKIYDEAEDRRKHHQLPKEHWEPAWDKLGEINVTVMETIRRLSPANSTYLTMANQLLEKQGTHEYTASKLGNILKALRSDIADGCMVSFSEIIHADLFTDFLEMSEHLLSQGYKDPSAVLAGSTLEEHLRKLCLKNAIPIVDSRGKKLTIDPMNVELVRKGVYLKPKQIDINGWAALRNAAAHGNYSAYNDADIKDLIINIRRFIGDYPA